MRFSGGNNTKPKTGSFFKNTLGLGFNKSNLGLGRDDLNAGKSGSPKNINLSIK